MENSQNNSQYENTMQIQKNKQVKLMIIGVAVLVIGLIGISYAFFNYTRTGSANVIKVGRIAFNSEQTGNAINLTNMFPIDVTNGIPDDATKVGTVTINITGDTTYSEGIEYLVTATNVSNTVGSKILPISIDVSYENTTGKTVGEEDSDYFSNRTSSTTSIYKVLSGSTITDNGRILVGYIAKGATGVDGNIVIKAYLDSEKVVISDTYPGENEDTNSDGYIDGTEPSFGEGKTVLTTEEWNSLQTNGISFQVKVEAQEGIWVDVANGTQLYNIISSQAVMDNVNSTYVQNVSTGDVDVKATYLNSEEKLPKVSRLANTPGIDFSQRSSNTNGRGLYTRAGTENTEYPIHYYRGQVYNNNVSFAGFCWLIVRTTDTGGIKLIYNGPQDENGTCTHLYSETSSESSNETSGESSNEVSPEVANGLKRKGEYTGITVNGNNSFSLDSTNPTHGGYMYGGSYTITEVHPGYDDDTSGSYFGESFTWDGEEYKLTNPKVDRDLTHHYTCNLKTADGSCSTIRYFYYDAYGYAYSIELTGGEGIAEAIEKIQTNDNDSLVKTYIDSWYRDNMTSYTNYLEDTIWCNDRSIPSELAYGGWKESGDIIRDLYFGAVESPPNIAYQDDFTMRTEPRLACPQKNDAFTVDNADGNKKLQYPVGLLTYDEVLLAGSVSRTYFTSNVDNPLVYLDAEVTFYTMSPSFASGNYLIALSGTGTDGHGGYMFSSWYGGLRPSISLKPGTVIEDDDSDGTLAKPYKVKMN